MPQRMAADGYLSTCRVITMRWMWPVPADPGDGKPRPELDKSNKGSYVERATGIEPA